MLFFDCQRYNFFQLFFVVVFCLFVTSCGTLERSGKQDKQNQPAVNPPELNFPEVMVIDSTDADHEYPPTKTLVFPADKDATTVSFIENGRASWYGPKFNGRLTANGERFDMNQMTAAHRTLPFNTVVLVENLDSGKSILVRINDRGPFAKNRIIDLSREAARKIGMIGSGTANVNLYVAQNSLKNSKTTNLKVATYTVQLGSFQTEAQAFNYSSKIKGSRVEIVRKKKRKIYRVYYGRFIDKKEAAQKQKELERKNFSGYVKQIENG